MENESIYIPENPSLAVKLLTHAGFEAGIVGGCTRDALLNTLPNDWDIATKAAPEEIKSIFKDYRTFDIGIKHGTVTVLINSEKIEITTYRIDGEYSDGRRPDEVYFTGSLKEDLRRRDFTINAIFYNDHIGFVDPFKGKEDIKNKIIRCVGDPHKRFQEDALRILRGIRFSSQLGFLVEDETKKAMFKNKDLLRNVSKERISSEFIKLLKGKGAASVLNEFREIFDFIIPELKNLEKNIWSHTISAMNTADDIILKLALLFQHIGEDEEASAKIAETVFKNIKITNAEGIKSSDVKDILELIRFQNMRIEENEKEVIKAISLLHGGKKQFERLLEIKKIHGKKTFEIEKVFSEVANKKICTTIKDLDINGNDLIKIGFKPGKTLGETLNLLLNKVLEKELQNDKNILIKEAIKLRDMK